MCESEEIGRFVSKSSDLITIQVNGTEEIYKNIKCFEFTPERRMMTRVVQSVNTGEVIVFSKGADSSLFSRSKETDKSVMSGI
jgi:magnesium-transporting ATPase (P-type)